MVRKEVLAVESRILANNDAVAAKNRAWLSGREILAINLVSSPGSGKTTLLEPTIADFPVRTALAVIEGDQATADDGERIRRAGAPVAQINTGSGCHRDAAMVARGLSELKPKAGSIVLIENVGNLVCPALFDLGERAKVVLFSVTEGEDKPLKYPYMFRAARVIVINEIDLLPHVDFSLETAIAHVRAVNPDAPVLQLSARTGKACPLGMPGLRTKRPQPVNSPLSVRRRDDSARFLAILKRVEFGELYRPGSDVTLSVKTLFANRAHAFGRGPLMSCGIRPKGSCSLVPREQHLDKV